MKKLFTSAAALAVGTVAIPPSSQAQDKPWNVGATVRGFYDDNYTTAANNAPGGKPHSFGFEISPSVDYRLALEPTVITAGYKYGMRYFEDRASNHQPSADHSHDVNLKLVHQFPERYRLEISDNFVVAQEPTLLSTTLVNTPLRSEGNNIRNVANAIFSGEFSPIFGYDLVYTHTFYDYTAKGNNSFSALLDRIEHLAGVDLRWNALQNTTALVGYRFGLVDMTSNDKIFNDGVKTLVAANTRNNTSHYVFLGADHFFTRQLRGSARVGVQYTDYSKAFPSSTTKTSPYADFSATWNYVERSAITFGVKHARNATDIASGTLDAESTSVYGQWSHYLTPRLKGNVIGQYQMSSFNGGLNNKKNDSIFLAGLNLSYEFIKDRLSGEVGYNFDRLDSDIGGRTYSRNRAYIGLRASY
jgi:hypothetical protein